MSQLHGHAGLKVFGLHANFFFFSFMPINISKYLYRKNSMQNCQITLSMGDLVVFFYAFLNYFFLSEIQAAREKRGAEFLGKYQLIVLNTYFKI